MARVVQTEKVKKGKKNKILIIVGIILVLVVASLLLYKFFFKKGESRTRIEVKVLDSMEEYGYSLSDNDSKFYKQEYDTLKSILKDNQVDQSKYVEQVAKMFVIDLYTIKTKINKYDIGGSDYYYRDKKGMYEQKVIDTLYSTLLDNTYGDRVQELPQVKSIEVISNEGIIYKLGNKNSECYQIKLKWTYEKDLGYDDKGSLVVCEENGNRWSVVDFQPTLSPKYEKNS